MYLENKLCFGLWVSKNSSRQWKLPPTKQNDNPFPWLDVIFSDQNNRIQHWVEWKSSLNLMRKTFDDNLKAKKTKLLKDCVCLCVCSTKNKICDFFFIWRYIFKFKKFEGVLSSFFKPSQNLNVWEKKVFVRKRNTEEIRTYTKANSLSNWKVSIELRSLGLWVLEILLESGMCIKNLPCIFPHLSCPL